MMIIRGVELKDATAIAEIYRHHVVNGTATFEITAPTVSETEQKISHITSQNSVFLVAEKDGDILGYAYATPFRDRPAYQMTCEDSIYIRQNATGQGVGSALLGRMIEEADAIGFRQMIAVIGGGEPSSVALHAKFGFEHRGRMQSVGRKFGRWLDTVYMQKILGDGALTAPQIEP